MVSQDFLKRALPSRVGWPIVGRDDDVALLLQQLSSGSGGVVVMGSPGMGKSTVVTSAVTQLRHDKGQDNHQHVLLLHAPQEQAGAVRYVEQWLGVRAASPATLEAVAEQILALVIAGAAATGTGTGSGAATGPPPPAAPIPILVLDDLHLVDNFSAGVLARLVTDGQIKLVGTAREEPGLPPALNSLWRGGRIDRVDLVPLSYDSIRLILGAALPGPSSNDMAYRLWEATAGNPLHVRELLYSIVEAGDVSYAEHAWVWTAPLRTNRRLIDLLASDISALSGTERDVVDLVSLAESIPLSLLAPTATDAVLSTLVDHGLVLVTTARGEPTVRIGHPLYAETLRSLLYPRRKRELLTLLPEPNPERGSPQELCRWVDWALECGLMPSPTVLLAAGTARERLSEPERAAALAVLALDHEQLQPQERLTAILLSARANRDAGRSAAAEADLALLGGLENDGLAIADVVIVARARILADIRQRHGGDLDGALEILAEAAQDVEPGAAAATELAVELLGRLGFGGRHAQLLAGYGPQLASANHPANVSLAPSYVYALAQAGRPLEALELAERNIKLVGTEHADFPLLRANLMSARFWSAVLAGRPDLTMALPDYVEDGIQRHDSALYQAGAGYICLLFGAWEQAVSDLHGGLSRMGLLAPTGLEAMVWAGLAQAHAMRGERAEALHACQQFESLLPAMDRSVEVDSRYRVLLAKLALGLEGLEQEISSYVTFAQGQGLLLGVLLGRHLQVVTAASSRRGALLPALAATAEQVQGRLPGALLAHAQALNDGDAGAVSAAAAGLAQVGIWLPAPAKVLSLTPRQQEIAAMVAAGMSSKSIGEKLNISVRTVDTHVGHIFTRVGVNTRAELTRVLTVTIE
ncbi:helix-turn-helix transcriptional regulator [Arthrobacter sp. Sr24]